MSVQPDLLAPVALLIDLPEYGLTRGEMGAIVERLAAGGEQAFLVEFADDEGQTYALVELKPEQFIILHSRPRAA